MDSMPTESQPPPCAACKFLRRKCQPNCVFAPHFPPDNPQRFAKIHRIFGVGNVSKLLFMVSPSQREETIDSLEFEAKQRIKDPIHGCVRQITDLMNRIQELQMKLSLVKDELSKHQPSSCNSHVIPASGVLGGSMLKNDINQTAASENIVKTSSQFSQSSCDKDSDSSSESDEEISKEKKTLRRRSL